MAHIIRTIPRTPQVDVEALARLSPATIHEAQDRQGAVDCRIRPIYSGMRVCGPAVTARCHPGDNMMLIAAIDVAGPGDVLVVQGGGLADQGGFGEVLATACIARGIAGLVTDASVRDGPALRELGFPVFARGLAIRGTVKETLGSVNHAVVMGGVPVRPGDLVCGDDDGVVVVRREAAGRTIKASQERDAREARLMEALRRGESILAISGIGEKLRQKGCEWQE